MTFSKSHVTILVIVMAQTDKFYTISQHLNLPRLNDHYQSQPYKQVFYLSKLLIWDK